MAATYSAANADGELDVEHKETLANSTIRAFVLGGSGGDAAGLIEGYAGLVEYIKNGGDYSKDSPGAPIAYKLAYLDNVVTHFAFTTDYAQAECQKNRVTLRVTDDEGKVAIGTGQVLLVGDPPVADAGGPYSFGEDFAVGGVYTVPLDGTGSIIFSGAAATPGTIEIAEDMTLTLGPDVTVSASYGRIDSGGLETATLVNQGTISGHHVTFNVDVQKTLDSWSNCCCNGQTFSPCVLAGIPCPIDTIIISGVVRTIFSIGVILIPVILIFIM